MEFRLKWTSRIRRGRHGEVGIVEFGLFAAGEESSGTRRKRERCGRLEPMVRVTGLQEAVKWIMRCDGGTRPPDESRHRDDEKYAPPPQKNRDPYGDRSTRGTRDGERNENQRQSRPAT